MNNTSPNFRIMRHSLEDVAFVTDYLKSNKDREDFNGIFFVKKQAGVSFFLPSDFNIEALATLFEVIPKELKEPALSRVVIIYPQVWFDEVMNEQTDEPESTADTQQSDGKNTTH